MRVALSTGRSESAERHLRQKLVAGTIGVESPESRLIRRELRAKVEQAIGEALAQLESRDRLVLRLHLVSGMSMTAIAGIFGVNHSTIGRRMRRVCDQLLAQITRSLEEIRVGESDLASVLRVVASQLDLSLARLLPAA
jgi:RNA polymerase sigma-70 factor (ECF subfamily)